MEKKYEEALERARMEYNADVTQGTKNVLETIFPELKESEDDGIRKAIIDIVKSQKEQQCHIDGAVYDKMIAWLEKQDSQYTFEIKRGHWYKCVCDYMLNGSDLIFKNGRFYYCRSDWRLGERNVKDIGVNGYKSFFRPATNQEIKDWIEKQGEQEEPQVYETEYGEVITYSESEGYKVAESKFHEGDWVVDRCGDTWKIKRVTNQFYLLEDVLGCETRSTIEWVNKTFHVWTLKDVKPGNVLFHSDSASNGIFIFKEFREHEFGKELICYCDYDSEDGFCLGEYHNCCWAHDKILRPATKEQREKLEKYMINAGYEWDADKLELIKFEVK